MGVPSPNRSFLVSVSDGRRPVSPVTPDPPPPLRPPYDRPSAPDLGPCRRPRGPVGAPVEVTSNSSVTEMSPTLSCVPLGVGSVGTSHTGTRSLSRSAINPGDPICLPG